MGRKLRLMVAFIAASGVAAGGVYLSQDVDSDVNTEEKLAAELNEERGLTEKLKLQVEVLQQQAGAMAIRCGAKVSEDADAMLCVGMDTMIKNYREELRKRIMCERLHKITDDMLMRVERAYCDGCRVDWCGDDDVESRIKCKRCIECRRFKTITGAD